ncbi:MAG: sensor histidine kinase [Ornithinibacter sp.]
MTHVDAHQPCGPAHSCGPGPAPVSSALAWGLHLLVVTLLVIAAGRSVVDQGPGWPWVVVGASSVGVVYALGARMPVGLSAPSVRWWLALLLATWGVLLALTPDAIYLAFAWFFLLLHLLPRPAGLAAVALTTAAAVAGFAWHRETFTAAMVIGPVLGAAVAIATVFGYQAVRVESEQRRRLIVELDRTRAELATAQHRSGVLDERERLAREIHDTLAQGLSSIQLLLRAAGRSLDPERGVDPVRAAGLVEQARQAAQDDLLEARRVVRALAPADLEESTLAAALERVCDTASARTGMAVTFHLVGQAPDLATPVEVALLRIAQGALGNTAQHSGATRADVTLTCMDAEVTLDVVDDGRGFDPPSLFRDHTEQSGQGATGGFGLRSMRTRAADVGGVLSVESRVGGGTAISVRVDTEVASATDDSVTSLVEQIRARAR